MKLDCSIRNPLVRDGVSQAQRFLSALSPQSVLVDERSTSDLLYFAYQYARQLQYYDTQDLPNGDWQAFFENDVSTTVAIISKKDLQEYLDIRVALQNQFTSHEPKDKEWMRAFALLFDLIYTMAHEVNGWYVNSVKGLKLHTELHRIITSQLRDSFYHTLIYSYYAKKHKFITDDVSYNPVVNLEDLRSVVDVEKHPFESIWFSGLTESSNRWSDYIHEIENCVNNVTNEQCNLEDDKDTLLRKVSDVYDLFYNSLRQIINQTPHFFEETIQNWPSHEPHMALFLAFLQLYKVAQKQLNGITKKHLDFYYKDILRLKLKPAVPDRVHVLFELAKQFDTHKIEAGTKLKAGHDQNGKEILYQLDREIVVNKTKVSQLKTVFLERKKSNQNNNGTAKEVQRIFAAPQANSKNGQGEEFTEDEPKWNTLGENQRTSSGNQYRNVANWSMGYATIGFAISSPILLLGEKTRVIDIQLHLDEAQTIQTNDVKSALKAQLTGEEGWIDVTPNEVTQNNDYLNINLELDAGKSPIIPLDPEIHEENFDTAHPVLKIVFVNDIETEYGYQILKNTLISKIVIQVQVDEVENIIIQNDSGVLSVNKPYFPFGNLPTVGSKFYVGSKEIFQKQIKSLTLHFHWKNVPSSDLGAYYENLKPDDESNENGNFYSNDSFLCKSNVLVNREWDELNGNIQILIDGKWEETPGQSNEIPLFNREDAKSTNVVRFQSAENNQEANETIIPGAEIEQDSMEYNVDSRNGFLRLELSQPSIAFGHDRYRKVYTTRIIQFAHNPNSANGNSDTDPAGQIPNEPYTPEIESLTLDYAAESVLDFSQSSNAIASKFYHLYPFGYKELQGDESGAIPLVPQFQIERSGQMFDNEGELYIGLAGLQPRQNLSLLFQMAEGSADPDLPKQPVDWSYLKENEWQSFDAKEIVYDSTDGLTTSGIIQFDVPKDATANNTVLPSGYHWLRASVTENAGAICDTIDIAAQAAQATFIDQNNDLSQLDRTVPAGTISKLHVKQAAIKSVNQKYASLGGKPQEGSASFYQRVSERLRHKNRGITIWDYERIVLEQFSTVYKAKCINHSTYLYKDDGIQINRSEFAPGFVTLIVIPDLNNKNAVNPLEPRVSIKILNEIKLFLTQLISPFASETLQVINPLYEQAKVEFGVKFHQGYDRGYYEGQLNQDIQKYLSPWAFSEGQDISFGGKIHRSSILNFVEERPYVDYVVEFQMHHFIQNSVHKMNVEEIIPTTARSIVVSSENHTIKEAKSCS